MYIRKKPVAALYKLFIGVIALVLWWFLLVQYGWSALRLFPTWVCGIAAIYFIVVAALLALRQSSESGKNPCPMLEGMVLMGFLLTSGVAIASTIDGFYLPELPIWVIVMACGILPVLVLLDWLFFVKKGRWYVMDPFYWLALPACYCATMIFTAELLPDGLTDWHYPLLALNYLEFGLFDMLGWILVVVILELSVGYVLFLVDFAMSGKLAKKIVLPHIRTVIVDEAGIENAAISPETKVPAFEKEKDEVKHSSEDKNVTKNSKMKTKTTNTAKADHARVKKANSSSKTSASHKTRSKSQKAKDSKNTKTQDNEALREARNSRNS